MLLLPKVVTSKVPSGIFMEVFNLFNISITVFNGSFPMAVLRDKGALKLGLSN